MHARRKTWLFTTIQLKPGKSGNKDETWIFNRAISVDLAIIFISSVSFIDYES